MLSDVEKLEIEAKIADSHDPRAACIELMEIIQSHRGYISDEALQDIADLLKMSAEELDGVATFCSLIFRQPVGRHVLKVCDSVSCWIMGGESVMEYLEKKLGIKAGETTSDGRITLLPICCLGDCDHAPAMMVDDKQVGNITAELLDKILESPELA
jgi:NADH-quinone oxidoreductase subunit E